MVEPSLVARIDDWRFQNRIGSRSQAMRSLIQNAIKADEENGPAATAIAPDLNTTHPR
jgi:metal-responsive CopG/Arc/MetJ family transcriptional regulator